jgi:hypothetical protein
MLMQAGRAWWPLRWNKSRTFLGSKIVPFWRAKKSAQWLEPEERGKLPWKRVVLIRYASNIARRFWICQMLTTCPRGIPMPQARS